MTFLEAAIEVLRLEGGALHVRDITRYAQKHKLLTHVGRAPEETMKQRLEAEVLRATGQVVRVKGDVYTLPEGARLPPPRAVVTFEPDPDESEDSLAEAATPRTESQGVAKVSDGRRKRRRGGRGRGGRGGRGGDGAERAAGRATGESARAVDSASAPAARPLAATPAVRAAAGTLAGAPAGAPTGVGDTARKGRRRRRGRADSAKAPGTADRQLATTPAAPRTPADRAPRRGGAQQAPAASFAPTESSAHTASTQSRSTSSTASTSSASPLTMADAAAQLLKAHAAGRPVHYRQLVDMAQKRRLLPADLPDAYRAMRIALRMDDVDRSSQGLRPRFRAVGSGLYVHADESEETGALEERLLDDVRALAAGAQRTLAVRLAALPIPAIEICARLLLQRMGSDQVRVQKRTDRDVVLRVSSSRSDLLFAICSGSLALDAAHLHTLALAAPAAADANSANPTRRIVVALGGADESARRLAAERNIEMRDAAAFAELLVAHNIGVLRAPVSVVRVDHAFLSDLAEPV